MPTLENLTPLEFAAFSLNGESDGLHQTILMVAEISSGIAHDGHNRRLGSQFLGES